MPFDKSNFYVRCVDGLFIVDREHEKETTIAAERIASKNTHSSFAGSISLSDMVAWADVNKIPYSTNTYREFPVDVTETFKTELQGDWVGGRVPDKITIGCYDYTINRVKEPIIVDGAKCHGKIDYHAHEISIADDDCYSEQSKEQTLWHEIIHGIIRYRNVNYGKADEETFVDELATGLYLLCKSNGLLPGQNITKEE